MMSSESVWFEQVDTAFIHHIKEIVRLGDSEIPVKVRKPDEDFKVESYPSITLYNLYSRRDNIRFFPDEIKVASDVVNHKCILEKGAIPFTLYYQIDFWSRNQSQMNDMTRIWLGHHPDPDFILPVHDVSGNERDCHVLLNDSMLNKSDNISGIERTFHSVLTYKVLVEIDEKIQREVDMITEKPTIKMEVL